jgi:uncharacterized protein (DUF433 family)
LLREAQDAGEPATVSIGELVRVDIGKALGDVRRRLALYVRVREPIESDPGITGRNPTLRGTGITVHPLLGRIAGGDTIDSILEDNPYLDCETLKGAAVFAAANPPCGRPPGKPWRSVS